MSYETLSTKKVDNTKSKMFLDESGTTNIARYDQLKYKVFDRLTEEQLGFFWLPQEIDLSKDSTDFRALTVNEQFIFTSNIKRQIVLDSVQGRAPSLAFLPICSLPELENWIQTWVFSETIHSRSYSHLIKNVYSDPSKVFDGIMDIVEIVDCAKDITQYYDNLIEFNNISPTRTEDDKNRYYDFKYQHKKLLWLALNAVNALEGVRFYVSFACSWAFAELKKMEGNAKIIKLICMPEDHEILTDKGWKYFKDLDKTELVAQYTKDGFIEFVSPSNYIEEDFKGNLLNFKNKSNYFDGSYTPNHRIIYKEEGILKESTAEKFKPSCKKYFINSGKKLIGNSNLTTEEQFRIAVQADGNISDRYNGNICGHVSVLFTLKKEHKIINLENIIKKLNFKFKKTKVKNKINTYVYNIEVPIEFNIKKDFNWVDLTKINFQWAQSFIKELSKWDGHLKNKDYSNIYYSTISESCADVVQSIATLSGWRSYMGIQKDNRKKTYNDVYRLFIIPETDVYNCGNDKNKNNEYYEGKVYCVTVPSGMIVTRRNKKVMITGNCKDENLHLASTQTILKLLPKDDPDFIKIREELEPDVIKMFQSVIDQEKAWADYLFKDGSMIGLNAQLLKDYVEFIANSRMNSIGLKQLFKTRTNPLPWTQTWISGKSVQVAPQETEITSYITGGTKQDVSDTTFEGFEL